MDKREKIRVVGYRVDSLILIISVCKGGNYVKRSGKLIIFWYYSILEKTNIVFENTLDRFEEIRNYALIKSDTCETRFYISFHDQHMDFFPSQMLNVTVKLPSFLSKMCGILVTKQSFL